MLRKILITISIASMLLLVNSASAISLYSAVHMALTSHPTVHSREALYAASIKRVREAFGAYLPTADLTGGYGREYANNPSTRAVDNNGNLLTRKEGQLDVRETVFDGGLRHHAYVEQKDNMHASRFDLLEQDNTIAYSAAEAYLNIIRQRRDIEVLKDDVDSHRRMLKNIKRKLSAGAGRKSELQLSRSRLASALNRLYEGYSNLETLKATYKNIVGTDAPEYMLMPHRKLTLPRNLTQAIALAYHVNPTVNAANMEFHASKERIGVANAAYYPTFFINLDGRESDDLNGVPGFNRNYQAMLRMTYNLYRGGSDTAAKEAALEESNSAFFDKLATMRDTRENVTATWQQLHYLQVRLPYLREHSEQSLLVWQSYLREFEIGHRSLFDLLNAASEYYRAKIAYIDGQFANLILRYQLLSEIGNLVSQLQHLY